MCRMTALNQEFFSEFQPQELDLFNLSPTLTSIEKVTYQQIRPINQLTPFSPCEFLVSGNNSLSYVDLRNSFLSLKVKIVHGTTGADLKSTEYVGPVNLILHSLFERIDVTLQGKLISTSSNHYPYKAYLRKLLSLGRESKLSQMSTQLWMKDTQQDSDDAKTGDLFLFLYCDGSRYSSSSSLLPMICTVFLLPPGAGADTDPPGPDEPDVDGVGNAWEAKLAASVTA